MRILCTNQSLDSRAGSESYLEAVVPELRRLGHDVELFCLRGGSVAERLRAARFVVHERAEDLVSTYDVVHAQHASTALAARARLPMVPIVFVSHSWFLDIEDPPAAATPGALVALNDLVRQRLAASALGSRVRIHRLAQPVVVGRSDRLRAPIGTRSRQAFALSRNLNTRIPELREACAAAGLVATVVGHDADEVADPRLEMMNADIVFGSGRTILEAMAVGRAAFVFDETGAAGFVTSDSYDRLEAVGFTPEAGPLEYDLRALLDRYDARLGTVGRELVVRHHTAQRHAVALVEVYRSVGAAEPPSSIDAIERLAIITQQAFESEVQERAAVWRAAAAQRRADRVQAELDAIHRSASWRLTTPLRWLKGRRRHRSSGA